VKKPTVLFSEAAGKSLSGYQVLIINNIGQLSSLYRYGRIAYIGGGFGAGIHNILEPAASGLPVVFGPNYHKFREAEDLVRLGGAFPISRYRDFEMIINDMAGNEEALTISATTARDYVQSHTGATEKIITQLFT
jgi:3-deoxy-D-manno-octulosonic-acid transferase